MGRKKFSMRLSLHDGNLLLNAHCMCGWFNPRTHIVTEKHVFYHYHTHSSNIHTNVLNTLDPGSMQRTCSSLYFFNASCSLLCFQNDCFSCTARFFRARAFQVINTRALSIHTTLHKVRGADGTFDYVRCVVLFSGRSRWVQKGQVYSRVASMMSWLSKVFFGLYGLWNTMLKMLTSELREALRWSPFS